MSAHYSESGIDKFIFCMFKLGCHSLPSEEGYYTTCVAQHELHVNIKKQSQLKVVSLCTHLFVGRDYIPVSWVCKIADNSYAVRTGRYIGPVGNPGWIPILSRSVQDEFEKV